MQIYELHNTGKGIITSINPDDLILIYDSNTGKQGFQEVLNVNSNLVDSNYVTINQDLRFDTVLGGRGAMGVRADSPDDFHPHAYIGKGRGNLTTDVSLFFVTSRAVFRDYQNNRGLEYDGDYEANFLPRSLVTKQFVESKTTGSETKIINGLNTIITGNGTIATPYVINSATPDGSETKVTAGAGISVSGVGTTLNPYVISTPSTPSVLVLNLNSWTKDRQHSILTGLSGVNILGVHVMLQCIVANTGYSVGDIVTVNTPELNDSGGRPDQGIGVQYNNNNVSVIRVMTNTEIAIMGAWTSDGATNTEVSIGDETQWSIRLIVTYI